MQQEDNIELYRRTLKKWGEQAQYDQVIEECAELTTALLHYRRDKADASRVVDEMADVILMLGQLRWMFGAAEVERAVERKRAKLEELLLHEDAALRGDVE
ncbi:MAG: antitoxin [Desulfuromonadaceae bacterium]|nr:antitoxin [Desulfuromonadaceae bacterium]